MFDNASRKIRYGAIVIIIILSAAFFGYFGVAIYADFMDITTTPKSRSFAVPINIDLQGVKGFGNPPISIGLNFIYPNGTLYVNDNVSIYGYAYLRPDVTENITMIAVGFQNCLEYPIVDAFWGIPKQGFVQIREEMPTIGVNQQTGEVEKFWLGNETVTWSIEGEYKPIIGIFYKDGTNTTLTTDDVVIHVYPKEQLTQVKTNKVTVELAIVALAISGLGILSILMQIWPKKEASNVEDLCKLIKQRLESQQQPQNREPKAPKKP